MGILLTDISAIECYRADDTPVLARRRAPALGSALARKTFQPTTSDINELGLRGFGFLSQPVHVLVPDGGMRRRAEGVTFHTLEQAMPAATCFTIQHGIFSISPELSLAFVARHASTAELIQLCYEMCGTYRLTEYGFRPAPTIASPASLKAFTRHHSDIRGSLKLTRATRYALPNSASPMETATAMLLSLPPALGGYGLPAPKLNYRVDVPESLIAAAGKRFFVMDLCWPQAKLAVEYDSDQFHTGTDRIAADAARRNSLLSMGFQVVTIGRQQIMSLTKMDATAAVLAKYLDTRLRPQAHEWRTKQADLRCVVLPSRNRLDR